MAMNARTATTALSESQSGSQFAGLPGWRAHNRADPDWWINEHFEGRSLAEVLRQRDISSLFRFLKSRGWSQAAVAAATGTTENQVRAVIQGRQRVTSYDVLERIAERLDIPRGLMGLAYVP
ncbi:MULTISPECIES: helix-turn-helix domain-containing protein [Micromonospora]|uniref:Helix-turn-helix domain-containing protein n=1 Tax=Micromonospora craniellae TaxID=2294034 RepID=A0A372FSQ0_9ACTN|nr:MULTISPECIES: helix-turn-helix domain-containing protein [Micromonospora]QOC95005.1 helix-turn-helix domain-containing protein [Micromonospora craniellae]RFS43606.1 helix-turn-helix domain-containing protein [Micromonospora craniellae]RNH98139.1 helix-turn-helix domain-containing protein [Micromonospora aurantiaca]